MFMFAQLLKFIYYATTLGGAPVGPRPPRGLPWPPGGLPHRASGRDGRLFARCGDSQGGGGGQELQVQVAEERRGEVEGHTEIALPTSVLARQIPSFAMVSIFCRNKFFTMIFSKREKM